MAATISSNSAPLTWETLPFDCKEHVYPHLDLPDLASLCLVSKEDNANIKKCNSLWKKIALGMGFIPSNGLPAYGQVQQFIKGVLQKVAKVPAVIGDLNIFCPRPIDITTRLFKNGRHTREDLHLFQVWLRAKDTLTICRKLIEAIGHRNRQWLINLDEQTFSLLRDNYTFSANSERVIERAKEFTTWCAANSELLAQIDVLDLSKLGLTSLPEEIGYLSGLKNLNLKNNRLSELPTACTNFRSLTHINLENNEFATIPPCLAELPKLRVLKMKGNLLKTVPAWVFFQRNLKSLSFADNPIRSLPKGYLKWIKQLELVDDEPFELLPDAIWRRIARATNYPNLLPEDEEIAWPVLEHICTL